MKRALTSPAKPARRARDSRIRDTLPLTRKDALKYVGQWVAVKDGKVVHAAVSDNEITRWVVDNKIRVDLVLEIPPKEIRAWFL